MGHGSLLPPWSAGFRRAVEEKFVRDRAGAQVHQTYGIAFVTNQELTLAERKSLVESARPIAVELYHLERIATVLDRRVKPIVKRFYTRLYSDRKVSNHRRHIICQR